jgi:hypothetical protein
MFKKISFRLGMEGGLYIGICLGALTAATLILCLLLLLSPDTLTLIVVTVALLLSSILGAGIVIYAQKMREKSPDQLCTCRYRSSLYTYCRQCALREKSTGSSDRSDLPDK